MAALPTVPQRLTPMTPSEAVPVVDLRTLRWMRKSTDLDSCVVASRASSVVYSDSPMCKVALGWRYAAASRTMR